ncbi:MAG: photosystem I reaction center subunit XII [Pseudanabaenaceae cyanobacterium]|jgi:photosystem I reaction center subunit XII
MGISESQVLTALAIALFPAVMALMLGTALSDA